MFLKIQIKNGYRIESITFVYYTFTSSSSRGDNVIRMTINQFLILIYAHMSLLLKESSTVDEFFVSLPLPLSLSLSLFFIILYDFQFSVEKTPSS